jgi:hypothetical protein
MKKFADTFKGDVIKIDGVCYEFAGYEEAPAALDVTGDVDVFSTCEECEQQSSAIDQSSEVQQSSAEVISSEIRQSSAEAVSSEVQQSSAEVISSEIRQSSAIDQQSSAVSSAAGFPPSLVCPDPSEPGTVAGPSVVLSVSGPSGTINWCGKTWNLPGDNNVTKPVCPTSYSRLQSTRYSGSQYYAKHEWQAPSADLWLVMAFRVIDYGYAWYGSAGFNYMRVNPFASTSPLASQRALALWALTVSTPKAAPVGPACCASFTQDYLTGVTPSLGAKPSYYQYIQDWMFGSHTAGGVTYTWARGNGWPS